jgi:hypothetical protein
MAEDPFYKKCCLADGECSGRIEWHHNLCWAGSNVNNKSCILPLCHHHHMIADYRDIKDKLNRIMAGRMTDDEKVNFSKVVRYDLMVPLLVV